MVLLCFLATKLHLIVTSSFFRFNQNKINILNPNKKCNRLVFFLFQNDDLKKVFIFDWLKKQHATFNYYIHKKYIFYLRKLYDQIAIKKFPMNITFIVWVLILCFLFFWLFPIFSPSNSNVSQFKTNYGSIILFSNLFFRQVEWRAEMYIWKVFQILFF